MHPSSSSPSLPFPRPLVSIDPHASPLHPLDLSPALSLHPETESGAGHYRMVLRLNHCWYSCLLGNYRGILCPNLAELPFTLRPICWRFERLRVPQRDVPEFTRASVPLTAEGRFFFCFFFLSKPVQSVLMCFIIEFELKL